MKALTEIKLKFKKVPFNDNALWKFYRAQVAAISTLVTIVSFCAPLPNGWLWRLGSLITFLAVLIGLFLYDWYEANQTCHAEIKINGTNVKVYVGDIFDQEGLKVIGVNNYIDLIPDDIVLSTSTLHGKFMLSHQGELDELTTAIANSTTLYSESGGSRSDQQSYACGSCLLYQDYVLAVLTKFDPQNKAYSSIQEYVQFWMTFWENIDTLYNSRTLNIPLMGAGQTRFRGTKPKKQELLEIALWTLKESGFRNNYADRSINFVIYSGDAPDIDFYRIQKMFG